MQLASVGKGGQVHVALDFEKKSVAAIAGLTGNLVCVDCGGRAFFRRRTKNGRAACFYADHRPNCKARSREVGDYGDGAAGTVPAKTSDSSVLIFDPSSSQSAADGGSVGAGINPTSKGKGKQFSTSVGGASRTHPHVRVSTLLQKLISTPSLSTDSNTVVRIDGVDRVASELFVRFGDVKKRIASGNLSRDRVYGFWGTLKFARMNPNGSLFLDCFGWAAFSVTLDKELTLHLFKKYGKFGGWNMSDVLVLGRLEQSKGKNSGVCNVSDLGSIAMSQVKKRQIAAGVSTNKTPTASRKP